MRDSLSSVIDPSKEAVLFAEVADFHSPVGDPSKFVKFGDTTCFAIVSEVTGVSTRAEVKERYRKAKLSREHILLGRMNHTEGTSAAAGLLFIKKKGRKRSACADNVA